MYESGLSDPKNYINPELSWLEFNYRVLEEAMDESNPLLERVKFAGIFATNLDEFFMIRVANLRELEEAKVSEVQADGLSPLEQLEQISIRAKELVNLHSRCIQESLLPALAEEGFFIRFYEDLSPSARAYFDEYFQDNVFPVLTPMTVDPSHPFPHLPNKSLNLAVTTKRARQEPGEEPSFAIVEIPNVIERLLPIPNTPGEYLILDDLILQNAGSLFSGIDILGAWTFRVTRNTDLSLEEREAENLLKDLERELRAQSFQRVVRLEVSEQMPQDVLIQLMQILDVQKREVYRITPPLHGQYLTRFLNYEDRTELFDPPFNPRLSPKLASPASIFSILRQSDILLHHPYESFSTVVELLQSAAHDKRVLAMKLTLYRTSGDSVIIQALKDAAKNGKHVTAVVELKARFDERNNIGWARSLERSGVHVVYGIVGLKTHCKIALVVRRESSGIRRYTHIGTGNYNSSTARLYTDLGLLTSDPLVGADISQLFNILTGYDASTLSDILDGYQAAPHFNRLLVAPFSLRTSLLRLIDAEIASHSEENPGLIQIKANSISEPSIIEALYRASQAGVRVNLCIRGLCCLRPGIPGLSENITVTSVIDRFLEHHRIYHFKAGGEHKVFFGSSDLMPRNLYRRIELLIPITDMEIKERLLNEIIWLSLNDNVKARRLLPDGSYQRVEPLPGDELIRSQERFIQLARKAGLKSDPYDNTLREARSLRRKKSGAHSK